MSTIHAEIRIICYLILKRKAETSPTVEIGDVDAGDLFGGDKDNDNNGKDGTTAKSGSITTTKDATTTTIRKGQDKDGDGWIDPWYHPNN